jgi:hypothetical protein
VQQKTTQRTALADRAIARRTSASAAQHQLAGVLDRYNLAAGHAMRRPLPSVP